MTSTTGENIILLPKTIEHYQRQLTQLLESEQYDEAFRLLEFLRNCQTSEPGIREEWDTLLEWLQDFMIETYDEEIKERDIFRQRIQTKASEDQDYLNKLTGALTNPDSSLEQKLLSLEQLSVLNQSDIDDILMHSISSFVTHPLIIIRTLQILRQRGVHGEVTVSFPGEQTNVRIEETPLDFEQFPAPFREVIALVSKVNEMREPGLIEFARQLWAQFSSYIYGTSLYK